MQQLAGHRPRSSTSKDGKAKRLFRQEQDKSKITNISSPFEHCVGGIPILWDLPGLNASSATQIHTRSQSM
jgi:hypothetical protein